MLELEPREPDIRVAFFKRLLAIADFANEDAIVIKKSCCMMQYDVDRFQTIDTGREPQLRLVAKLVGHGREIHGIDIGWITDNQVIAASLQLIEKIGPDWMNPSFQAMTGNIDTRHVERIGRNIDGIHIGVRKRTGQRNGYATTPRSQVGGTPDAGRIDPGLEPVYDEFSDRRARHENALVHEKLQPCEPGLPDEVRDRESLIDPTFCQCANGAILFPTYLARVGSRDVVVRQVQCRKDKPGRLVKRVVRPVPIVELRARKLISDTPDQPLHGWSLL